MLIILLICLNRIFKSFIAIDCFYKSCVKTDLATLYYITFIGPFDVLPTYAYINKVFESTSNDPFLLLEEHFFTSPPFWSKKNFEVQFEDLPRSCSLFFINIILVVYFCS
jgi:hypothetical protein